MNQSLILASMISLAVIIAPVLLVPAFANLVEFQNLDFGVSIKYPSEWEVDDEVVDYGAEPGFDKGVFSIVYFLDSYEFYTQSIEIILTKEDNIAKNNQGQKYLDRVEARIAENCEIAVMAIDGLECTNYNLVNSEIVEHNGFPAYQFTRTWTEKYPDGTFFELKGTLVDVVDGNDVWTIDGVSVESEFDNYSSTFDDVLDSFTLLKTRAETGEKIPEWVKSTMGWFADGLISEDEMISAIEFLINEGIIKLK